MRGPVRRMREKRQKKRDKKKEAKVDKKNKTFSRSLVPNEEETSSDTVTVWSIPT